MSDDRLRELERRWRETGALADHAAYLRVRSRLGDLEPERLQLALFLGSEVAALALEVDPFPALPSMLDPWVKAIGTFSLTALRRLAIAGADHVARMTSSSGVPPRALFSAEDQLICPCETHRLAALREAAALRAIPDIPMRTPSDLASAAEHAALAAAASSPEAVLASALAATQASRDALSRWPALPSEPSEERRLQAAVTRELLPWALDERDPVRERVERRSGKLPRGRLP